ncbi:MAG TPA: hypothetical protein H9887_00315, partial [Candidatus Dorea intestinavium]|nr:hypothetical protein [Candidatus Dorea intestinavium]
ELNIHKTGTWVNEKGEVLDKNLSNVTFKIYKDKDYKTEIDYNKDILNISKESIISNTDAVVTDDNGQINLKMRAGTYYLKEVEVGKANKAEGFVSPKGDKGQIGDVSLEHGQVIDKEVNNVSTYGRFKTLKIAGNDHAKALEGAEFKLYTKTNGKFEDYKIGDQVITIKSDKDGVIVSPLLPEGTNYYLKEVETPGIEDEYIDDNTDHMYGPYAVELKEGVPTCKDYTSEKPVINWKNFKIQVIKSNADKKKLEGAKFTLYDGKLDAAGKWVIDQEKKLSDGVTAADGTLTFNKLLNLKGTNGSALSEKSFFLVEEEAPDGYYTDKTPIEVPVTYEAIKADGQIVVVKKDVTNILGPILKLHKMGNLKNNTVNHTSGLPGVTFELKKVTGYEDGELKYSETLATGKTDSNGNVSFNKFVNNDNNNEILEDGQWYALRETAVPTEYQSNFDKDKAPYYYFKAKNGEETTSYYSDLTLTAANPLTFEGQGESSEPIKNQSNNTRLRVDKVDTGGNHLDSAWFALYKETDGEFKEYKKANFTDVGDLIAPDKAYFKVGKAGFVSEFFLGEGDYALVELGENINDSLKDKYPGLEAIASDIKDSGGTLAPYANVKVGGAADTTTIVFEPLKEATTFSLEQKDIEQENKALEIVNKPLGQLEVIKYGDKDNDGTISANDEKLEGVEYTLSNPEASYSKAEGTDEEGKIVYAKLAIGDYQLKETKAHPNYAINPNAEKVAIGKKADGSDITIADLEDATNGTNNLNLLYQKLELLNQSAKGYLKVIKTDASGKDKPLELADDDEVIFEIYKENTTSNTYDNTGEKIVINKDNYDVHGVFSDLLEGNANYKLKETKTKAGYLIKEGFIKDADGKDLVINLAANQDKNSITTQNINTVSVKNEYYPNYSENPATISKAVLDTKDNTYKNEISIDKNLSDKAKAPDSGDINATFKVSGYASGDNKFPLKDFTVLDGIFNNAGNNDPSGGIELLDKDGKVIPLYFDETGALRDYTIAGLAIGQAFNGDRNSGDWAKVDVLVKTKEAPEYKKFGETLTLDVVQEVKFDALKENVQAVKLVYSDTKEHFAADGFKLNTVFKNRSTWDESILKERNIVMKARNTASVNYKEIVYHELKENGKPNLDTAEEKEWNKPSNTVNINFNEPSRKKALAEISCAIVPAGKVDYIAGENINYRITSKVADNSPEKLYQPVIGFRMPLDTTLITESKDNHLLTVVLKGNGKENRTLIEGKDFEVYEQSDYDNGKPIHPVVSMEEGKFKEKESKNTKQYILVFNKTGEHEVTMDPGDIIDIDLGGKISNDTKASTDNLFLVTYLGSLTTIIPDASNQLGTSFSESNNAQKLKMEETLSNRMNKEMEFVHCFVKAGIKNSQNMGVEKSIGRTKEEAKGNITSIEVTPNGDIYYRLTLFNNTKETAKSVRLVDILPFGSDKMVLNSSQERGSTIPKTSQGLGNVELVSVEVDSHTAKDVEVNESVYGYGETAGKNSWETRNSNENNETGKLGMLYYNNASWNAPWADLSSLNKKDVSAVGLDLNFDGDFISGDSVSAYVHLKAPDFDETLIEYYKDKLLKNSVAGAMISNPEGKIPNSLRTEPDPVTAKIVLPKGSLGDYVWYDENGNGKQDRNEKGLENVQVHLYHLKHYRT